MIDNQTRKIALITGASRGLGKFSAKRFWDEGYDLFLVAQNKSKLNSIKTEFLNEQKQKQKQKLVLYTCDLANTENIAQLTLTFKNEFSHLNVLINNAAIQGPIGPFLNNDFLSWEETFKINFLAPAFLSKSMIPFMKNLSNASIINLSGGGASSPRPNFSAYACSKTALVRFSETLAMELEVFGIRVNCVAPGAMSTDMMSEIFDKGEINSGEKEYAVASKTLKDGGASMDNVANLLIFLSSNSGKDITGKLISAVWDNWGNWLNHLDQLNSSDIYTLRRITGKDRDIDWGDKNDI
jgi:NAD(P)-dependent dehydrogenase (short-subunit alcohol dehydrogenase family)